MATQSPISTISYNSLSFLKSVLDRLYSNHIIMAYQYIQHIGEDGDKDHIHLRIEPNKRLDPMDLQDMFLEYVPGSDKPLGVRPFRPSKEEDWYLYAVHDPDYLRIKYGDDSPDHEKLPYEYTQIVVSPFYDLDVAWIRARAALRHSAANLAKRIRDGETAMHLLETGENPHTINSITHALSKSEYHKEVEERLRLTQFLADLQKAIMEEGYSISLKDNGAFDSLQKLEEAGSEERSDP